MKKIFPLFIALIFVLNGFGTIKANEQNPIESIAGSNNLNNIVVPVSFPDINEFQIVNTGDRQKIEMIGFSYLMTPGKPMLPAKNLLIALPPGANVQSVDFKFDYATELPEVYQIIPYPHIMPLNNDRHIVERLQQEWEANNEAIYSLDDPYPSENGKLIGIVTSADLLGYIKKNNYSFDKLDEPTDKVIIKNVYTISGDKNVSESIRMMKSKDVGGILVVVDERLEGIITERDILEEII